MSESRKTDEGATSLGTPWRVEQLERVLKMKLGTDATRDAARAADIRATMSRTIDSARTMYRMGYSLGQTLAEREHALTKGPAVVQGESKSRNSTDPSDDG